MEPSPCFCRCFLQAFFAGIFLQTFLQASFIGTFARTYCAGFCAVALYPAHALPFRAISFSRTHGILLLYERYYDGGIQWDGHM